MAHTATEPYRPFPSPLTKIIRWPSTICKGILPSCQQELVRRFTIALHSCAWRKPLDIRCGRFCLRTRDWALDLECTLHMANRTNYLSLQFSSKLHQWSPPLWSPVSHLWHCLRWPSCDTYGKPNRVTRADHLDLIKILTFRLKHRNFLLLSVCFGSGWSVATRC